MAVEDVTEYYKSASTGSGHPISVNEEDRISIEMAEKIKNYVIVLKRDEVGRILAIEEVRKGVIESHFEYTYHSNSRLATTEIFILPTNFEIAAAGNENIEYYSKYLISIKKGRLPFNVSEKDKISEEKALKNDSYVVTSRDSANRISSIKKIKKGKWIFYVSYKYKDNGKPLSYTIHYPNE